MFHGTFKGVSRKIVGCSLRPLMVIQGSFKSIQKKVNVCFKAVSWTFQGCLNKVKRVSRTFQKKVSRVFQWSFVLKFCSCMDLIAANWAEGGLVFGGLKSLTSLFGSWLSSLSGDHPFWVVNSNWVQCPSLVTTHRGSSLTYKFY